MQTMSNSIKPFRIAVGDAVLAYLRPRLRNTRWARRNMFKETGPQA